MSIVIVKDGTMVVDSLCVSIDTYVGLMDKFQQVKPEYGGGWIAGVGACGEVIHLMSTFCETGKIAEYDSREAHFMHMNMHGAVYLCYEHNFWHQLKSEYHCIGSGSDTARGAMEAGATIVEAAKIVCRININCGIPINVLNADGSIL